MGEFHGPMNGRVAVVTGASSGLGLVTASSLARMGANVVMLNRDLERSEVAMEQISRDTGVTDLHLILMDLASFASVRHAAEALLHAFPRIDVLVNNAGLIAPERTMTEDEHETTLQVNHLGPFLLMTLVRDALMAAGPGARAVIVSSDAHRRTISLPLHDLDMTSRWSPFKAYSATKLENVLFARELARRLAGRGVTSNAVHPGAVATRFGSDGTGSFSFLWNGVMASLRKTPQDGADSQIWLASAPEAAGLDGAYVVDRRVVTPSKLALNDALARRLWAVSEQMVGEHWPDPLPALRTRTVGEPLEA